MRPNAGKGWVSTSAVLGSAALALGACSGAASTVATPPEYDPKGQTKCSVAASQSEPLIVEWPDAARGQLESMMQAGLVAVRYQGCEMDVLSHCAVNGSYRYRAFTPKRSRERMRTADELYATIPVFAFKWESTLESTGELNVEMTMVGRYQASRGSVSFEELSGDCAGATHVITAASVGAFEFFAGAEASLGVGAGVAGAESGGRGSASRRTLTQDGDLDRCRASDEKDEAPPFGCGALLRLEVAPISGLDAPVADRASDAPSAPERASRFRLAKSPVGAVVDTQTHLAWVRGEWGSKAVAVTGCRYGTTALRVDDSSETRGTPSAEREDAGWRVPTRRELEGLLAHKRALRGMGFDVRDEHCYWLASPPDAEEADDPLHTQCLSARGLRDGGKRAEIICVHGD